MSKTVNEALIYLFQRMNGKKPEGKTIAELIMSGADDYHGGGGGTQYTLTYALGEYGTGDVPDPVTVDAGTDVNIEFENDIPTREGYNFVGWATTDGAESATYTEDGTNTITMNDDVTLYPVFEAEPVTQYTLTYSLGNDATGSVPEAVTVDAGDTVNIDFSTYPSCVSDPTKVFVGWATTDESSTADYYDEPDHRNIALNSDVTLYPVFAAQSQGGSITIVNTSGKGHTVEVSQGGTSILTIAAGTQEVFNYTTGVKYNISSSMNTGVFDGVYNGNQYSNETLIYSTGAVADFYNPSGSSTDWEFSSGDSGTLTIS